jgi:hypothetical protein
MAAEGVAAIFQTPLSEEEEDVSAIVLPGESISIGPKVIIWPKLAPDPFVTGPVRRDSMGR